MLFGEGSSTLVRQGERPSERSTFGLETEDTVAPKDSAAGSRDTNRGICVQSGGCLSSEDVGRRQIERQ